MDEIRITLETLYDILRNEKKREDLQKLNDSFFIDVCSYMREKQAILESKQNAVDELFAEGERDKLEYELRSIKRILKQIYELREKKIIDIAINKSRTGSEIIDSSSMLRLEKEFYYTSLQNLDAYRRGILLQLFKGELPEITIMPASSYSSSLSSLPSPKKEIKEKPISTENHTNTTQSSLIPNSAAASTITSATTSITASNTNLTNSITSPMSVQTPVSIATDSAISKTKIKFIHPVPSFVWKDMKEYGPFDIGEQTEIFPEVAELLVRKGRAEKV